MRNSASLGDVSRVVSDVVPANHPSALGILSSLPTLLGTTRLAIFCSSTAIFNSQLPAAQQQIRLLQADNSTLQDAVKALSAKKTCLMAENEALLQEKAKLQNEKQKLLEELHVEKFQGIIRARKTREAGNIISGLLAAAKQRDQFVRAMIDIKLDQHVLHDAYAMLRDGQSADQAIIEAIRSAANKQASPWSKLLGPLDVSKSDLYKSAIELAATARLRMDESVRLARFWKHVAKYKDRNASIVTPSSSALDVINLEVQKEERGTVLDDLLKKLRSGEEIRKEEMKKQAFSVLPDTPDAVVSPTSETYRQDSRGTGSDSSVSILASDSCGRQPTDVTTMDVLSSRDSDFFAPENPNVASLLGPSSSLGRIYGAFTTTTSEEIVNNHERLASHSLGYLGLPTCSLHSLSVSATGRGRSATFPFSKRDLTLPPVKDVTSGLAVVTLPGDKEREVQAMVGQRARFYRGASLVRSKAVINRRCQGSRSQILKSPTKHARTSNVNTLTASKPAIPPLSIRNISHLPTPPPEGDSIAYVRPPTVTRKRVVQLVSHDTRSTIPPVSPISPTRVSSLPKDSKIRPYAIRGPPLSSKYQPNSPADGVSTRTSNQINKESPLLPLVSISESDKENISPRAEPLSASRGPRHRSPGSPIASSRTPPLRTNKRYPPSFTPMVPNLKVVQPLRIIKKSSVRNIGLHKPKSAASPVNASPQSRISLLPRVYNS